MSIGAHDIFTRLVVETRDTLRRYVRKLVHSDETAEEIVQEAFLRTYEKRDSVKTPQAFLFSTARNLATILELTDATRAPLAIFVYLIVLVDLFWFLTQQHYRHNRASENGGLFDTEVVDGGQRQHGRSRRLALE